MLSVKQAADRLGVLAKLVYALCAQGKIAHERHGLGRGTIRIAEEAMEECRECVTVGTG
jgi:excisionase family DNA binding protein